MQAWSVERHRLSSRIRRTARFTIAFRIGLLDQVHAGMRVRVPLGKSNRLVLGYCVAIETIHTARTCSKRSTNRSIKSLFARETSSTDPVDVAILPGAHGSGF